MSRPVAKRTEYDDAQAAELENWPGVTWRREVRGKHYALVLTLGDVSRFVMYPGSPSDCVRGRLNHLTDVRKALRDIGAVRTVQAKRAQVERKRIKPVERFKAGEPITGGPKRDPWAKLAELRVLHQAPPPEPVRRPWWARALAWLTGREAVVPHRRTDAGNGPGMKEQ